MSRIRNTSSTRRSRWRAIFTRSRTRLWHLTAYGGTVLVTAASTQAGVGGTEV